MFLNIEVRNDCFRLNQVMKIKEFVKVLHDLMRKGFYFFSDLQGAFEQEES